MSDRPDPVDDALVVDVPHDVAPEPAAEPDREPAPQPVIDAAPKALPTPVKRRGAVLPMVVGGVLAAVIGYGLAQVVPQGWPLAQVSDIAAKVNAQATTIAGLEAKLADSAKTPAPKLDPAVMDRLAALEATIGALTAPAEMTGRLDALEKQLAAIAAMPAGTGTADGAAMAQMQAEIAALKSGGTGLDSKLAEAQGKLDSVTAEAQAVVTKAAARAAMHQLQAALDSGAPYKSALTDIGATVPDVLTAHAEAGLPSLQGLRAAFPDAARAALAASLQATTGDSWADRIGTFLRGQTGARSLIPRDGTDPDAVLSRAEAAVNAGDLTTAMTELAGLPDAGKAAMADWMAQAQKRQDAVAAVQALSAGLGQ